MEAQLRITTLGGLSVHLNDAPVTGFVSRKVEALLVYLAVNAREHPREVLGELLWDDLPQQRTMGYLRTALSSLQKQLAPFLSVTRQTIGINPDSRIWLDVAILEAAIDEAESQWEDRQTFSRVTADTLSEALSLYQGGFLEGFTVRDCRSFEGWMLLEQERLRQRVLEAHYRLGTHYMQRGAHSQGVAHTTRALQLDPLWEAAHRQLMRLHAQAGQRSAAVAQYETARRLLDEELGVELDDETIALHDQIQLGDITVEMLAVNPNNLPVHQTPFVERPLALQQINEQIAQPACRLLTLTGPGGIGKTRLALEVARRQLPDYTHGVYFVSFAAVRDPDQIVRTIANALDVNLGSEFAQEEETLIKYLAEREMLLVLDNFETMLPNAEVLSHLLEGAPGLRLLITARERLNLVEEWLYMVEGLPVPAEHARPDEVEAFASVQLFAQTARRMTPDFRLTDHLPQIAQICRLVGGMPLAIELAASWLRMMSCDQIVEEVQRSLDFLATPLRNIPERHRSMRAVFDSSWNFLNAEEQRAFRQLAVFRGGFQREAAEKVVGASLFTLSSLVDKSLIVPIEGRYQIHELLRQYALERLNEQPEERERVGRQHSAYYAGFLQTMEDRLPRVLPNSSYEIVIDEIGNILLAWQDALRTGDAAQIDGFLRPLFRLYDMQSSYKACDDMLQAAIERLEQIDGAGLPAARARLLSGICNFRMDGYELAQMLIHQALPLLQAHQRDWEVRQGLTALGAVAALSGDYLQAREHYTTVAGMLRAGGDRLALANMLFRLGSASTMLGEYEVARRYLDEGRELVRGGDHLHATMHYHIARGDLDVQLGDYSAAHDHFETALALSDQIESRSNSAMVMADLAKALVALGDYERARSLCAESIVRNTDIHNRWGIAYATLYLGKACYGTGDYDEAYHHLSRGIDLAGQISSKTSLAALLCERGRVQMALGDTAGALTDLRAALNVSLNPLIAPLALDALAGLAQALAAAYTARAMQIAAYIAAHPATSAESRRTAQNLLDTHNEGESATADDLQAMVQAVLRDLPQ